MFKRLHSLTAQAFTRVRTLSFGVLLTVVLRNSVKALQNAVSEGLGEATANAGAYSQASHKFKHAAFIELNAKAVVATLYGDGDRRLL